MREVLASLRRGGGLQRHPWTRMNWIARGGRALLFAAGEMYPCSSELAGSLCGTSPARPDPGNLDETSLHALERLLADGHIQLVEP